MKHLLTYLSIAVPSSLLGGCAIGFDHTLFMTKSNIGVDIDTKPPTAEISIARRELVIAPAFEGGQTPSVLAGFNTGQRLLFGFDVSSVFAGGDAAKTLSSAGKAEDHSDKLCLEEAPVGKPHLGPVSLGTYPLPSKGEIKPFAFGTDTTFGLKVAWSGMTAQFPDSLKIGFNRKELALAPVFGQENPTSTDCKYSVEMPAFLATIEVGAEGKTPQSIESKYRQSFSTGKAANALAARSDVKLFLLERLDRSNEAALKAVEIKNKDLVAKKKVIEDFVAPNGIFDQKKLKDLATGTNAEKTVEDVDSLDKLKAFLNDYPLDIDDLHKKIPSQAIPTPPEGQ